MLIWLSLVADRGSAGPGSKAEPRMKPIFLASFVRWPELYMRGSTVSIPSNLQPHAYVCVGYRDHIVQRMEFDDHEDHEKNWNDTDDCAC